jgi:TetR/AcrR family transcriptional regulator
MTLRATSPATVPAALRQRRKEARPQELLDAALDLFVEKGFAATRSEEVATRAGVSKGTLYLYYPSKEELLKEVIRHNVVNQIAEGIEIVRAFEGSSSELLAHVLHLWWERVGETRASGILKLMMSEVRNFPEIAQFWVDEVISPAHQMIAEIVEGGIARGEFRPVNVENVVHALVAPLLFLVMNKHSLGACVPSARLDPQAVIGAQVDLVLHGLETSAGAAAAGKAAKPARATTPAKKRNGSKR